MTEQARSPRGSHPLTSRHQQGERQLYAEMLRDMAAEMRAGFNVATERIQSLRKALADCTTTAQLKDRLSRWDIEHLLSRHQRRPEPWPAQYANTLSAKRDKQLAELLSDPSRAEGRYAERCATITGYDSIPEAANITLKALKTKLLRWPPSLVRRAESPGNPLPKGTDRLRCFWEQDVLPALAEEYKDRFCSAEDDPFKPLHDRMVAVEILAELIESSTSPAPDRSRAVDPKTDNSLQLPSQQSTETKSEGITVNKESLEASYNNRQLNINAQADFRALAALWERCGRIVSHRDLFDAIKPNKVQATVKFSKAPPEVKEAIGHIKEAFREIGAPLRIEVARGIGYKLLSTDL